MQISSGYSEADEATRKALMREIARETGRSHEELELHSTGTCMEGRQARRQCDHLSFWKGLARDRREHLRSNRALAWQLLTEFDAEVERLEQLSTRDTAQERRLRYVRHKRDILSRELGSSSK